MWQPFSSELTVSDLPMAAYVSPRFGKSIGKELVLLQRQIRSPEEFFRFFPFAAKVFFIDGTERPVRRSSDLEKQRAEYSGKKKRHTRKNIVSADSEKRIPVLTETEPGRIHDYKSSENSGIAESLPEGTTANADLGFQGIGKDFPHLDVVIPHKKTRSRELTPDQKSKNRAIPSHRILTENAIFGIKCMKSFESRKSGCGQWWTP